MSSVFNCNCFCKRPLPWFAQKSQKHKNEKEAKKKQIFGSSLGSANVKSNAMQFYCTLLLSGLFCVHALLKYSNDYNFICCWLFVCAFLSLSLWPKFKCMRINLAINLMPRLILGFAFWFLPASFIAVQLKARKKKLRTKHGKEKVRFFSP